MQMGRMPMNVENKMPRKILSSSLTQDVKLRSIDNAWKPILYKNSSDDSKDSTDLLIKNARGILNKLTPQNFKKLLDQFLGLKIDTENKLRKMIELIFDKSVDEPAFCDQYALLCKHLSNIQIESDKGTPIKFNNLLLEKCQSLFEQDKYKELDLASRQKVIDECKDKEKKQILKDELDEDKRLVRKKSLGNIKFIGALYKNNRLKEKIMNECIYHLLDEKEEDSYECLCSLLKSIGETYEKSITDSKQDLKRNFDKQMIALEDVVKHNQVSSRIKFLIMDVLDMRKEGWKVRKLQDTFKPKTLDEVHEDIKRQDEISNREINQISKRNDSMKRKDWMNPQRKSQQNESLMNIRKLTETNKQIQTNFAPTGFFTSWSSGALGAKPVESDNSKPASLVSKNFSFRYQSDDKYKNSSLKQRNSSNVEKNVETINTFGGNYHGGDETKDLSFISIYETILKEYIETGSLDDCLRAIYQKSTENCVYLFVQSATEQACETYLKEIHKIGNLLAELVCVKKVISYQQFYKGLKYHLDTAQEVVKDIPLFFEYFGQILSHFFFKLPDQDRRSFFKEALRPCLEIGESLTIIIHLLKTLVSSKENVVEIAKKWVNSGLSFEDFVNNETEASVNEILESNGLSSLLNEINTFKNDIVVQIEAADFKDIVKVLKNLNVKDKTLSKKIISALFEKCILNSVDNLPNGDPQLDKDSLMSNLKNFQQSITENLSPKILQDADIQLEIIYSFIKVSGSLKNPKDFLCNVAVILQESDIVEQETFLKWFKENNKLRSNNSLAILQLRRFIEVLELDDSDGDEDIADAN